MRGQDRRCRQQWEQTRQLETLIYKVLTGQDLNMSLPWDEDTAATREMTPEELQEMWAKARAMEEMVNRRGGNL